MKRMLVAIALVLMFPACDKSSDSKADKSGDPADRSSQLNEAAELVKQRDPEKGREMEENLRQIEKSKGDLAATRGRDNLCQLLDQALIREVFALQKDVELKVSDSGIVCTYSWEDDGVAYSASLNFSSSKPMSASAAKAQWDKLNAMPMIADSDLGRVKGVGEQAIWGDLGGGQLRVLAKGNIFYVSVRRDSPAWTMAAMGFQSPLQDGKQLSKEEAEALQEKARDASKKDAIKLAKKIVTRL